MIWTRRTVPTGVASITGIVWTGDRFIAGDSGSYGTCGHVISSTNGIDWETMFDNTDYYFDKFTFGNSAVLAVVSRFSNSSLAGVYRSTDNGVSWSRRVSAAYYFRDIAHGNGLFVAVGYKSIAYSSDGITWAASTSPNRNNNFYAVGYGNGIFVAVGISDAGAQVIYTSTNGNTWDAQTHGYIGQAGTPFNSCEFLNGYFLVGGTLGKIVVSTNGLDWVVVDIGNAMGPITASCFVNDRFVIGAWATPYVMSSLGILTGWEADSLATTLSVHDFAVGNGFAVLVAGSAKLLTTPVIPSGPAQNIHGLSVLNKSLFGFKLETTPYTPETLTAADYKYSVSDVKVVPDVESYIQKLCAGDYSKPPAIAGKRSCAVNFFVDVYGMETPAAPPSYFEILRACGWKQTVHGTTGVSIRPDSLYNRVPTTIEVPIDQEGDAPKQLVYKLSGAMGRAKIIIAVGKPVRIEFSFIGSLDKIYTRAFADRIAAAVFDDALPPAFMNASVTWMGRTAIMNEAEIDDNGVLNLFSEITRASGYSGARVVDKFLTCKFKISGLAE